jgi:hypothetical protein
MALPDFLCVGAQKAGTTTLYHTLKQHPDIFLSPDEEVHFFDDDAHYGQGLSWYENRFAGHRGERAVGEVTPAYLYFDYVPQRIRDSLGSDIKLIFIFRDPATRAFSHYLMNVRKGFEDRSFEEALTLEPERIRGGYRERLIYSYINRGLYSTQLKRYLELFPKESMLFLVFEEDIKKNREETFRKVCAHLNVDPIDLNTSGHQNPALMPRSRILGKVLYAESSIVRNLKRLLPIGLKDGLKSLLMKRADSRLSPELHEHILLEHFRDDIRELEKLTGLDLSVWQSSKGTR